MRYVFEHPASSRQYLRGLRGIQKKQDRDERGHGDSEVFDTTIRVVAPSPSPNTFSLNRQHPTSHRTRDLATSPFSPQPLNIRKNSSSTNSSSTSDANHDNKMGQALSKTRFKDYRKSRRSLHFVADYKIMIEDCLVRLRVSEIWLTICPFLGQRISSDGGYMSDGEHGCLNLEPQHQTSHPQNHIHPTNANGKNNPGSLLSQVSSSPACERVTAGGDLCTSSHYLLRNASGEKSNRFSISDMYFGRECILLPILKSWRPS